MKAGGGEKKIAKENATHMQILYSALGGLNLAYVLLCVVYGSDSFSWLHWVGFFYHILVYTVVIWFLNKQASTGQKFAACFTGWGNCVLLIIPGYGLYLGGGYLYSWVSTPEDEPEEVTPEEAAKLEKKDRQKARQERLYGNRR